jgi:methylmalonyl-CoA mutase C-terminal domain/subunit
LGSLLPLSDRARAAPRSKPEPGKGQRKIHVSFSNADRRTDSLVQTTLLKIPLASYNPGKTGEIMTDKKIRVLIAKPGLDGHDRGAKVVARALRDDGMEVIYTGLRQTPEMISEAALQEDVDVIGLSILSGAHNALIPQVIKKLHDNGQTHVIVFLGGIIPEDDIKGMLDAGIHKVYGPGTDTRLVCQDIREAVQARALAD